VLDQQGIDQLGKAASGLARTYGKAVEIRLVRLHYPFLDTTILSEYCALNSVDYSFDQIAQQLAETARRQSAGNSRSVTAKNEGKSYFTNLRIRIAGLSLEPQATTLSSVRPDRDTLTANDISMYTTKSKQGSFTVRTWVS
jgi:hypothetical protein